MYLLINKFDLIKIIIKCRFMGRKGRHKDKDTWQHTEKSNYALYRFAIIFHRSFLCRIFFFSFFIQNSKTENYVSNSFGDLNFVGDKYLMFYIFLFHLENYCWILYKKAQRKNYIRHLISSSDCECSKNFFFCSFHFILSQIYNAQCSTKTHIMTAFWAIRENWLQHQTALQFSINLIVFMEQWKIV